MRTHLRHLWETLTSGYWFVPALMTVAAAGIAFALLAVDRGMAGADERSGWLYGGGAEGAKTVLGTISGSVITVAGVVFSITIVSLTQASSQFGPRLLRNFMRDTGNQIVLGTFVGTFLYCLLVLRTIHGKLEDGASFVPQASVTFGVVLAVASLAVLIYFIHHVSISLQAPAVIAAVRADLDRVIDRLREEAEQTPVAFPSAELALPPDFEATARVVASTSEGYLQAVDYDGLVETAQQAGVVLRLAYRPGHFVIRCTPLLHLAPADRSNAELDAALNRAFICGQYATTEQDLEAGIRQMTEVAVRALSPGTNDPFTAINCIDALGAAFCRIAKRRLPAPLLYDANGVLRVATPVTTFGGIVDTGFNQIRQYGRDSVAVTMRLLEVITICAGQTSDAQRAPLRRHAEMVYRQSRAAVTEPQDRADIQSRWEAAARAVGVDPEYPGPQLPFPP